MAKFIVLQLAATIGAIVVVYAMDWDFMFAGEAIGLASVALLLIWTKMVNAKAAKPLRDINQVPLSGQGQE